MSRVATNKEMGELAELKFNYVATKKGHSISIPTGDSRPYDCVADVGGNLYRVQIKSTRAKTRCDAYSLKIKGSNDTAYKKDDFDFLVCYLVGPDVWYIIPHKKLGTPNVYIGKNSKYEKYCENWDFNV